MQTPHLILTSSLVLAGLCLGTGLGLMPAPANPGATPTVARAATTTVASGTLANSDVTWTLDSTGTLQLGAAQQTQTLPATAANTQVSPLKAAVAAQTSDPITRIDLRGTVQLPAAASGLFAGLPALTGIDQIENLDTSAATTLQNLFYNDTALTTLDVSQFDTRNVTSTYAMFYGNAALTSFDASAWQTPKLTTTFLMFSQAASLTSANLAGWDVSQLTNAGFMFAGCDQLRTLDLSDWAPKSQVLDSMLSYSTGLSRLTVGQQTDLTNSGLALVDSTNLWQATDGQVTSLTGDRQFSTADLLALYNGTHAAQLPKNATFVGASSTVSPVTVHVVDQSGNALRAPQTLTGDWATAYTVTAPQLPNYTLIATKGATTGYYSTDPQSVTFVYQYLAPSTGEAGSSSSSSGAATDSSTGVGNQVDRVSMTAVKKIGLYKDATFTAKQRIRWYPKQAKPNRPQFVVLKTGDSKAGRLRFYVKDVNPKSPAYGQRGYITAKAGYVQATYAQTKPAAVKVTAKAGLNGYTRANLTGKKTHYRVGQTLKVRRLVTHNLTTRYQLTDGHYVSANREFSTTIK